MLGVQVKFGLSPLAPPVFHFPAVVLCDLLVAEAEAQDGDVEVVDFLCVLRIFAV